MTITEHGYFNKTNVDFIEVNSIVIKYYFATQNNILCVIGYKISNEFITI